MKYLILFLILQVSLSKGSVVGISTHPLSETARVLSTEITGYMSQRNEMAAGLRYTHGVERGRIFDLGVSGAQSARGLILTTGMDIELLEEDASQPRLSLKPYFQHQKFEASKLNLIGLGPILRKSFSIDGHEFFPYLSIPSGLRIDSSNDEFKYYSSVTFGTSMVLPGSESKHFVLSIEGNKDLGASSDYIGALISWIWK